ncbi:choline transporter-like protein 2 [Argopecten irradians]|uniref:choline transporter-like protein 2 n=1 Tax=Argopecten irradians TaxID=31199 RepID=UPI0037240149
MCGGSKVEDMEEDGKDVKKKVDAGEPRKYDPNFKGPLKNRSCTDIICCLLFLFFLTGMVVCSILGFTRGNPYKLIYPTDSSGNICGLDSKAGKPYLMYFDVLQCAKMGANAIVAGCPTPQVCVSSCTSDYWVYLEAIATTSTSGLLCKDSVDTTSVTWSQISTLVSNEDCAAYYVKNTPIVGRCVPSFFLEITNYAANLQTSGAYNLTTSSGGSVTANEMTDASYYLAKFYTATQYIEMVFKDIVASWWLLLVFAGIAMVTCFIWIILLRWIAGVMVWISVVLVFGLLGFACYYSYSQYYELKNQNSTATYGISEAFALNFSYYLQLKETWLAFGCSTATFIIIFLLIFIFLVKRICIAIELIKEASRAIGHMIFTLIWPIFPFLLQVCVVGYFGVSVAFIASMGQAEYYNNSTNTSTDGVNYYLERVTCTPNDTTLGSLCDFVKYGGTEYIIPMQVFMLFMFLWLNNFVIAFGQMVLAGSFASYYWAFEKPKDIPHFPITGSIWRALRYHTGSLAFGSLILAIVQFIRIVLEYLDHKLKDSENRLAKFFVKCLKCCFWCLEKCVKFLNRNAYIIVAVYGKNFCSAAKDAFFLILRNVVRAVVLDKLTDYVLFLSKLVVTAGVGVGSYFWFQGKINFFSGYVPTLNFYITPIVIVIIGTFLITCAFFSVYTMAVDTLFLCFLEDLEMHDGSAEKPYFMSKGLMKIIGKKNKFKDPEEDNKKSKGKKEK